MKVNFIFLKKFLIGILGLTALYYLATLTFLLISQPNPTQNNFSAISNSQYAESVTDQNMSETSSSSFDYKVVGYRAGQNRASVIVEKNNQTYVVQQGELLDNRYKLISVDSEVAVFSQNGKNYSLSTQLHKEN
jgi:myo-inositol-hexaphosphate 3-phosphohydrolase